jgi:hypothetical protein
VFNNGCFFVSLRVKAISERLGSIGDTACVYGQCADGGKAEADEECGQLLLFWCQTDLYVVLQDKRLAGD